MTAENIDHAYTRNYSRVEKVVERFVRSESFQDEKFLFLLKIAAIQDYRQQQSFGNVRFS